MLRGSGLDGFSGMLPVQGKYCRPLLDVTKDEIVQYAETNNIPFCIDPSNATSLRGKIRDILHIGPPMVRQYIVFLKVHALWLWILILQQHTNEYWEAWKPWLFGIPVPINGSSPHPNSCVKKIFTISKYTDTIQTTRQF